MINSGKNLIHVNALDASVDIKFKPRCKLINHTITMMFFDNNHNLHHHTNIDDEPLCGSDDCEIVEFRIPPFKVPSGTTYACFSFPLPDAVAKRRLHAVRIDPIAGVTAVHHMQLLSTMFRSKIVTGRDCTRVSMQLLISWSWSEVMHKQSIPDDVSLPLSASTAHVDDRPLYHAAFTVGDKPMSFDDEAIVIEMHYSNDANIPNLVDWSGFKVYLAAPRAHVGDVVTVGSMLSRGIAPGLSQVHKSGVCKLPFGVQPLTVLSYIPHMHRRGRSMSLYLATPNDPEQPNSGFRIKRQLLLDEPFDFNAQRSIVLDPPLLLDSNDLLVTTCTYNTEHDNETVRWGQGSDSEMCYVFLMFVENVQRWDHCMTAVYDGLFTVDMLGTSMQL
jgi:hypothetical protein